MGLAFISRHVFYLAFVLPVGEFCNYLIAQ